MAKKQQTAKLKKYTLKDNRIYIQGLGIVEKPKAGEALPDEVVITLFETCEEAGLSASKIESAYLVEIEQKAETETTVETDQAE